ncbi:MAG: peroxiredoxin family protein [Planctomycetota bacterium]|jgi:cytochrome c biogenesis protein CcmG/thiol:disulfide interchange protein DsbE
MSGQQFVWTRRGVVLSYFAILLMAGFLFFINVLPQFVAAGYKDSIPWMGTSANVFKWVYPALQIALILGVGLTMAAPSASNFERIGIVFLLFTSLVYLWPSVVYIGNLPSSWLHGSGFGHVYPSIVPFIQAWLFAGMLTQLAKWCAVNCHGTQSKAGNSRTTDKQAWERAFTGLRFLVIVGAVWLVVWLVLYYLPIVIPRLSLLYIRFFRLWMMLPQLGMFGLMVMLAAFSRPVTRVIQLLKSYVYEGSASQDPQVQQSGNTMESMRPVGFIFTGLALFSYASYLASQKWLEPAYAAKQREVLKVKLDKFEEDFQKANAEPVSSIGTDAPNLMMEPIEGDMVSLESLRGKVVVLYFCSTESIPCAVELPTLNLLSNGKWKENVEVLGLSTESKSVLQAFSKENKIDFPLMSSKDWPAPFNTIRVMPTTYIIDAQGIIRERIVGMKGLSKYKAAIEKVLSVSGKKENESTP